MRRFLALALAVLATLSLALEPAAAADRRPIVIDAARLKEMPSGDTVPVAAGGTGATTLTAHGVVIGNGTGAVAVTSAGTTGHVLTSNGASADPTFQAAAGGAGGALVLLEQHTASSSASLNFTTAFSSSYDTYLIEFVGLLPATTGVFLYMRCSTNGGGSYDSGSNYDHAYNYTNNAGSVGDPANSSQAQITIFGTIANTATGGLSATGRIYNPASTTLHKTIHVNGNAYVNDSRWYRFDSMGAYKSATAVNAVQFFMSSGNIASGTIRVYGVVK